MPIQNGNTVQIQLLSPLKRSSAFGFVDKLNIVGKDPFYWPHSGFNNIVYMYDKTVISN